MNVCALDERIVLGHEEDQVVSIIDYLVTLFAVFGDRLNIRDLVSRPSGKRTYRIFNPEELSINIVASFFAEQVHLCLGVIGKDPVGKDYAYRHQRKGKQKCSYD